jgi:hypothetical protein
MIITQLLFLARRTSVSTKPPVRRHPFSLVKVTPSAEMYDATFSGQLPLVLAGDSTM